MFPHLISESDFEVLFFFQAVFVPFVFVHILIFVETQDLLYKIVDSEINTVSSWRKAHLSFVYAINVELCVKLVRSGLGFEACYYGFFQCTRDLEPSSDTLFLCFCLVLGFPPLHCSPERNSLLQLSPVYLNFSGCLLACGWGRNGRGMGHSLIF